MDRRSFLRGLGFIAAAPFIVKASSLMPVRAFLDGEGELVVTLQDNYEILVAVTRRAFIPSVNVQIYQASPLLISLQNAIS